MGSGQYNGEQTLFSKVPERFLAGRREQRLKRLRINAVADEPHRTFTEQKMCPCRMTAAKVALVRRRVAAARARQHPGLVPNRFAEGDRVAQSVADVRQLRALREQVRRGEIGRASQAARFEDRRTVEGGAPEDLQGRVAAAVAGLGIAGKRRRQRLQPLVECGLFDLRQKEGAVAVAVLAVLRQMSDLTVKVHQRRAQLFEVVLAGGGPAPLPRPLNGGQCESQQQRDHPDHHEEFDQRPAATMMFLPHATVRSPAARQHDCFHHGSHVQGIAFIHRVLNREDVLGTRL